MDKFMVITAGLLGVLLLANGIFMVLAPEPWYWSVPGVPERGPFNQHFIRDIGFIYCLIAVALILGIGNKLHRPVWWTVAAVWLLCHALFHVWEVAVGICGPASLVEDFMGVTLPALLVTFIAFQAWRQANALD